ncbi:hypothetical protein SAMN04489761_3738 [Tenacibaculum sp. MAR_2009_124]|uniref:hypothetical protein n=1 Tax=Tenacibaculum sp. MAR_2009_124 TaxID=1250059 RepID=UPI000899D4E7|nr:hypothetical protein [Tenacibaculum sp. MAR_2009_124]SEC84066.1 hypothetical protein SAMN04489761_3738 [Tenacibaculum sp. MAR_2009_124]
MIVEDYILFDWEETETGVVLDENENWILIKSIPVDFQIDGYKLINKKYIENRFSNNNESLKKVLKLRKSVFEKPQGFEYNNDVIEIFKQIETQYGCFEFQDEMEDELFYGVLNEINKDGFYIDSIKSDGVVDLDFDVEFSKDSIRIISFGSDYFKAICLLFNDQKNR